MRQRLRWDVLFVLEEAELRRAPDVKHYQLAQQLRRTLVTMDRDYLDDRRFPLDSSGGVLVIQAPDERQLIALLERVDRTLFRADPSAGSGQAPSTGSGQAPSTSSGQAPSTSSGQAGDRIAQPLVGRKLQVNTDWGRE